MAPLVSSTLVVVTGANRGFGRHIVEQIAKKVQPASKILLLGRDSSTLNEVKSYITAKNSVDAEYYSGYECANLDTVALEKFLTSATEGSAFENLVVVHNAGTVGDVSTPASELSLEDAQTYMSINFSSMIASNNLVLSVFGNISHRFVVHISSLCALAPFKALSLYCSGKAARDMFFKVFAIENPAIRVISYAPGPMETAMFNQIKNDSFDPDTLKMFAELTPVQADVSAQKLVEIIIEDRYESGAHIDFFDE